MQTIFIYNSTEELATEAASLIEEIANAAISKNDRFSIALAGGSTPKKLYELLPDRKIDWSKTVVFFGDERNVPADDDQSNYKMANDAFLKEIPIPVENIFRWNTTLDPASAAADYNVKLTGQFGSDLPRFDIVLLGLGEDGHTASLFPGSEALNEDRFAATANWVETLDEYRLTLTLPLINNASNVIFLISGDSKKEIAAKVIENTSEEANFPADMVKPSDGKLFWMLDESASEDLKQI